MPSACFDVNNDVSTHWKHAKGITLRYDKFADLTHRQKKHHGHLLSDEKHVANL